jgi:pimeloyl-ACP methyl ester carboxylesterase
LNNINDEYLKINNSNLFYSVTGEGEPLVFIHGNFNDSRIWDYQIDNFASDYKVIRYDLRGYGKSDTPIASFSHCEDLKALFDSLKIKNVTIIGSSFGGSVAVDFALQYPELLKALILVAPSINGYRYPLRITYEAMKSIYLLKSKGFEVAIEKFINNPFWQYLFPPEYRQDAREKVLQTIRTKKNFYSWDFKLAIPTKPYASSRLRKIQVPVLIVLSDKDKAFNIKVGQCVHKEIRNAKKVVINDCGHLPFVEKPEEFNRKVLDFLKEAL